MATDWKTETLQERPPEGLWRLHALAEEYHRRTEAYDRRVCTGPVGKDGVLPANPRERALIEANAREVRDELAGRAAALGIEKAGLWKAIREWRR